MKFVEGMVLGGLLVAGASFMYSDMSNKNQAKKVMKKGKQFARKIGIV